MESNEVKNIIEKKRKDYEKELNKKIKGEKVPPQDDKSSVKPTRKPIKIKNYPTAYEESIYTKDDKSEKMLDKLNASYYNTPKTLAERNRPLRLSQKIINKDTGKRMFYLWPTKGRTLGLNTKIIDNYTENPKRVPKMSYAVPLYYKEDLPEGWRHDVVEMDNKDQEMVGLSYWTGPITYKDRGDGKNYTIEVTILDYPSKKRLEEEAKYYTLSTYKGKYIGPEHLTPKENKMLDELLDKFERNLKEKKKKRLKDLEEDTPGGKSFFEEGVKTREHEKKPSKIFGYKWGDLKVGGRKRKTRRKRGANYKGRVIFLDFNIEKMKQIGIIPEIYNYADNLNLLHKYRVIEDNGGVLKLMHIDDKEYKGLKLPISFVKNGTVTIQIIPKKSGGRRTRKNKRSKKRRGKKRKTRKKRRKRR